MQFVLNDQVRGRRRLVVFGDLKAEHSADAVVRMGEVEIVAEPQ